MPTKRLPLPRGQDRAFLALATDIERQERARRSDNRTGADAKALDGAKTITIPAVGRVIVYHGLGRQPQGWRITDRDKAGSVWRVFWDATIITLDTDATADLTIQLEVM